MYKGLTVTKRFTVDYGHILPGYNGKCGRQHGHTGIIETTFKRPTDYEDYPGILLDFGEIKKYVKDVLDTWIDHHDLNSAEHILADEDAKKAFQMFEIDPNLPEEIVENITRVYWSTTAENIIQFLALKILKTPIGDGLVKIRMHETPDSWVELDLTEWSQ
jgi:6-pyruvoyltetrahydropterin/6-carboxytetrahydropterin synthase